MKKLATLLALGFSAIALAQVDAPTFEAVDGDSDGEISRAEAGLIEGMDFDGMDTNKDGSVSKDEYTASTDE